MADAALDHDRAAGSSSRAIMPGAGQGVRAGRAGQGFACGGPMLTMSAHLGKADIPPQGRDFRF